MRIFIPFALIVLFLAWAMYRLFVKKDLNKHRNEVYSGLFFMGIWGIIYWTMSM